MYRIFKQEKLGTDSSKDEEQELYNLSKEQKEKEQAEKIATLKKSIQKIINNYSSSAGSPTNLFGRIKKALETEKDEKSKEIARDINSDHWDIFAGKDMLSVVNDVLVFICFSLKLTSIQDLNLFRGKNNNEYNIPPIIVEICKVVSESCELYHPTEPELNGVENRVAVRKIMAVPNRDYIPNEYEQEFTEATSMIAVLRRFLKREENLDLIKARTTNPSDHQTVSFAPPKLVQ